MRAEPVHRAEAARRPGSSPRPRCSALIVGFAAQHTIANMVAGVQLAVSQPIRIGDRIELRGDRGPGHRHHPLLHLRRPRRRQLGRDPQPAAGRRHRPQPLDRRHAGLSAAPRSTLCSMTQRNRRRQRRRGGIGEQAAVRRRRRPRRWSRSPRSASPPGSSTSPPTRPRSPPASRSTRAATRPSTPPTAASSASIASDEARTPVSIKRIPRSLQLATVAIEDQRFYEHGGVDPEGDPARRGQGPRSRRSGRGRLDDHPAAGPQPLHLQPRAEPRTQDRRGEAGRSSTPKRHSQQEILGQYLNIASYGTIEGSTAVGVQAASQDLLLAAGLEAEPARRRRCSPACRRRPPNTTRSSTRRRRERGATRCCGKMAKLGYVSHDRGRGGRARAGSASTSPTATSTTASPTSSTTSRTS